jgi:hypothetical protein
MVANLFANRKKGLNFNVVVTSDLISRLCKSDCPPYSEEDAWV